VGDRSSLLRGQTVDVAIERGVYRGLGLARHEGQVVFVPRGLPGERLRVRVTGVEKGYARAVAVETLEASRDRRASPCPLFSSCGGCAYQDLGYAAQLRLKEAILRESLSRAGRPWEGEIPIEGSPEQGWRTRASLHVDARSDPVRLGFYEQESHDVVDLSGPCLQISPGMNGATRHLRDVLSSLRTLARQVRDVHLAESVDGSQCVASFEGHLSPAEAAVLASAAAEASWPTGLGAVITTRGRRRFIALRGSPYLTAEVAGVRFRSHARSFFQSNRFLVGALAGEVTRLVPPGGLLLDLFGGVGLFGLTAGRSSDRVVIAEEDATAVADARENAGAPGLGHVRVDRGQVAEVLARHPPEPGERIVVDPPRSGLGANLVSSIAARSPEVVVYVSCDPTTLGRDLRFFSSAHYEVDAIRAFDLFPDTFHLETVVRLRSAFRR